MRDTNAIRAILFDKDGTLIDFNRTWFGIISSLAHQAAGGDESLARDRIAAGGYDWTLKKFVGGSVVAAGTIEDLVDLWHPHLGGSERGALIASYDAVAVAQGSRNAVGIATLQPTLETLRDAGYLLGIATNDSVAGALATAEALQLTHLFATIIGYDSVVQAKPWPDQLQLFATRTGLVPQAIAMVGDNSHDLEMARAAGAGLAIGVLSGNSTRAELTDLADIVIDSIADLPKLFGLA